MTATLLLLLPNLEEIEIHTSYATRLQKIDGVLRRAGRLQSADLSTSSFSLSKLSTLTIRMARGTIYIESLLQIPSLRSLECEGPEDRQNRNFIIFPNPLILPTPINLESISFKNPKVSFSDLLCIIEKCACLKHIHLELNPEIAARPSNIESTFKSLGHVKHQLESLVIRNNSSTIGYHELDEEKPHHMLSLQSLGFDNLHTLELDYIDDDNRRTISIPPPADSGKKSKHLSTRVFTFTDFPKSIEPRRS